MWRAEAKLQGEDLFIELAQAETHWRTPKTAKQTLKSTRLAEFCHILLLLEDLRRTLRRSVISRSRCQDDVSGHFWKHPPLRRRLRDLHPAYFRLVGPSYPQRSWPLCCQSCVTCSFEAIFICYTSLHWKFCPSIWIGLTDVYHRTNQFVLHFRQFLRAGIPHFSSKFEDLLVLNPWWLGDTPF